jgi:hypothetical protein
MNTVKQQHTATGTSILTTKSTYRSLSAQRLSEHTVLLLCVWCILPCTIQHAVNVFYLLLLLILQSFDWLAAFNLKLLQAILFIAV